MKKQTIEEPCKVRDCPHPALHNGLCGIHLLKDKPNVHIPRCNDKGCKKVALLDGKCLYHYKQRLDAERQNRCYFLGCLQQATQKGLCKKHYRRYLFACTKLCTFSGCSSPQMAQGFCYTHHLQLLQQQTLHALRRPSKSPVAFIPVPITVEMLFALNQLNPKSRIEAIQTVLTEWLYSLKSSEINIPVKAGRAPPEAAPLPASEPDNRDIVLSFGALPYPTRMEILHSLGSIHPSLVLTPVEEEEDQLTDSELLRKLLYRAQQAGCADRVLAELYLATREQSD